MVHKTSMSFRGHAYERLWESKPAGVSFSEWVEELALKGLDISAEIKNTKRSKEERAHADSNRESTNAWFLAKNTASGELLMEELEFYPEHHFPVHPDCPTHRIPLSLCTFCTNTALVAPYEPMVEPLKEQ